MSEIKHAQQAIYEFLRERIEKKIEQEQKSKKDAFTENDAQKIRDKHEARTWVNYIAENTDELFLNVSHVAKLTHPSSRAMSLKDSIMQTSYLHLVTTQTTNMGLLDNGYTNAIYSPVAEFLSYPVKNSAKKLGELLSEYEQCFALISDSKEERESWCKQIKQAYESQKIRTHVLAKQIYIPVAESCHLVTPMYSSSLTQHIYLAIQEARDKYNPAKLARKQNEWCEQPTISFPKVAVLKVTGGKGVSDIIKIARNVSLYHAERRGQLYLFSALPPKFTHNPKPPTSLKQILQHCSYNCKKIFTEIQALLYAVEKQDLFLNNTRQKILEEYIQAIMENILDTMTIVRRQYDYGWSNDYQLPMYVRLFIDGEILNTQTFSQPEIAGYIGELAVEFAQWINNKIDKSYQKDFEIMWCKTIIPMLQSHYRVLKAE